MKKSTIKILIAAVIEVLIILFISIYNKSEGAIIGYVPNTHINESIKLAAFEILDTKCNVCHKKKNPFMVFNYKNMDRRAAKIYLQVFKKKRMPKGDEIKLSESEYQILKNWLKTQNIY